MNPSIDSSNLQGLTEQEAAERLVAVGFNELPGAKRRTFRHILFLELIIDPACTFVFEMEADEPDIMRRPPRRLQEALFGRPIILSGLVQGLGVLASVLAVYATMMFLGKGAEEARMTAFVCLVIANLGLIYSNRSRAHSIFAVLRIPNKALVWVTGGAIGFLTLILSLPFLRDMFGFAPLHRSELAMIAVAACASVLVSESVKTRPFRKLTARAE